MSDERSRLTPGDPLRRGDDERHPSGLPAFGDDRAQDEHPHSAGDPGAQAWAVPARPSIEQPTADVRPAGDYPGGYAGPSRPVSQAPQYVLAGWGRRVGAAIIDLLIIALIAGVIMAILGIGAVAVDPSRGTGGMLVALGVSVLVFSVAALVYAPLMMAKTNGRTLGRMAAGIRVVRASGEPMTLGVAVLREVVLKGLVVGFASNVTGGLAYFIDVLWPLWDKENRALHDFPVDTRTILHTPDTST